MTHFITVDQIAPKPFHLFKTKKPVTSDDKIMWQTATDELIQPVTSVHASPGLMKGWSLVGLEMPKSKGTMLLQERADGSAEVKGMEMPGTDQFIRNGERQH